ncbi:hypothetical protein RHMOL_Rhmol02G0317700 [Rhododendron molle]|uniref:Uncharacterized protein n=1 Tax=Rhododendron molle TaxID=49168 RepID=A0ACC0PW20_RHOML|nr:hypothetical protein RHMOL_Rhmol02G0317700 [Rhododendron molle]
MQKQLDREIREMVSALINRLAQLQHNPDHVQKQQPAGSSHLHQQVADENDDENLGVRIVTLAGSNTGAAMRGELDDNNARADGQNDHEEDGLGTYVNSNFQAINNSIMLGGSYTSKDPGVHLDITDFLQLPHHTHHAGSSKHKRKEKETSRSDHQHSEPSSE